MGKSAKNWFGHNFWLWGPIDTGSTRLNCILQDLFRDTPSDRDLRIWPYFAVFGPTLRTFLCLRGLFNVIRTEFIWYVVSFTRPERHVSGLQSTVVDSSGRSLRACKVVADVWDTKYIQPHRNERLPPPSSFKHPCLQSQVEPEEWTRMVFGRRWIRWWFLLWRRFLLRRLFLWKRGLKLPEEDGTKEKEYDGKGDSFGSR